MTTYLRNTLTYVWAFLTVITVASWWLGQSGGTEFQIDASITIPVLVIAAVKALFVMQYFMEVRTAPVWLKRTAYGWVGIMLVLLLGSYWWGL